MRILYVFLLIGMKLLPQAAWGQWTTWSGVVNSYYQVTAVNAAQAEFTLTSAAGLQVGDRVVVMAMKGVSYTTANSAAYGQITNLQSVGSYEFGTVCDVAGQTITLEYVPLSAFSTAAGQVIQVIKVPRAINAEITGTITPQPWNGTTGGVVALEVLDTLRLSATVDVSGQGFRGGSFNENSSTCGFPNGLWPDFSYPSTSNRGGYKGEGIGNNVAGQEMGKGPRATGGGGGNDHNTGGAGGSNFGAGGQGGTRLNVGLGCFGDNVGIGGRALSALGYSTTNPHVFMGGGGGGGHQNNNESQPAGNGGGIILIRSGVFQPNGGSLLANGMSAANSRSDGASGGGAGGSILLQAAQAINSAVVLSASGGAGGGSNFINVPFCMGPGGGGGGGFIWTSFTPGGLAILNVAGGSNGFSSTLHPNCTCPGASRGAASGGNGGTATNLSLKESTVTSSDCSLPVLPIGRLTARMQDGLELQWSVSDAHAGNNVRIWRNESGNQRRMMLQERLARSGNSQGKGLDPAPLPGFNSYVLELIDADGRMLTTATAEVWVSQQNEVPVTLLSHGALRWDGKAKQPVEVYIFDAMGRQVWHSPAIQPAPGQVIPFPPDLALGWYMVQVKTNGDSRVLKWIFRE